MSFLEEEKVTMRRFMWYGVLGDFNIQAFGYRWMTEYGLMEFRFNNLQPQEEDYCRTLIQQIKTLEEKLFNVSCDLATDSAGPWKRNKNQLGEMHNLFKYWRLRMCEFYGLPPGPEYATTNRRRIII